MTKISTKAQLSGDSLPCRGERKNKTTAAALWFVEPNSNSTRVDWLVRMHALQRHLMNKNNDLSKNTIKFIKSPTLLQHSPALHPLTILDPENVAQLQAFSVSAPPGSQECKACVFSSLIKTINVT